MKRIRLALSSLLVTSALCLCSCSNSAGPSASSDLVFYGRVCLGPDKTHSDLILNFIVRGSEIFLDANRDNQAQAGERLQATELPLIEDRAAGVTYHVKELRLTKAQEMVSEELPQCLAMTVAIAGKVNYEQIGQIFMSPVAEAPQWVHFHGRNRMIFGDPDIELTANETVQLKVYFGTNAVGEGRDLGTPKILEADQQVDWSQVSVSDRFATILPKEGCEHPEMTIEIPTTGETYRARIPLNEFC